MGFDKAYLQVACLPLNEFLRIELSTAISYGGG